MAIEIYRRGDWDRWEYGDFHAMDILRLDAEKDRWLLWYILSHISENRRRRLMARLRMDQLPEPPVNVDDRDDALYAPYIMLREQVMREEDYWVLRQAAFEAPDDMMRRFAFCRLTGFGWPPSECDAYSYRTYSCGLKRGVSREDIEDVCREMIERGGPFAREAARWLGELPAIGDDELSEWSAGTTERSFDRDPDMRLRRRLRLAEGRPEAEDLADKVCALFDACVMEIYERKIVGASGVIRREAMDEYSRELCPLVRSRVKSSDSIVDAISGALLVAGRLKDGLTREAIDGIAWSVSPRSPQHSFFLWMAHWYPIGRDQADDGLALKLLADAAERGHMYALRQIVAIYTEGKHVRRDFRLALHWQEKKVDLLRKACEAGGSEGAAQDPARRRYAEALRETGDLLMREGYAKRAKQYYRRADDFNREHTPG